MASESACAYEGLLLDCDLRLCSLLIALAKRPGSASSLLAIACAVVILCLLIKCVLGSELRQIELRKNDWAIEGQLRGSRNAPDASSIVPLGLWARRGPWSGLSNARSSPARDHVHTSVLHFTSLRVLVLAPGRPAIRSCLLCAAALANDLGRLTV